jgi:hypothetical protein
MKKCPYCGKEYPDEATMCSIDGESLPDNTLKSTIAEVQAIDSAPRKDKSYLTFPDYQWSAIDAWKCVVMLFLFGFILFGINHLFYSFFPNFWRSGLGIFSEYVLHYSVELLVAAYFARTETLATFWKGFSLDRKPSDYVWFQCYLREKSDSLWDCILCHFAYNTSLLFVSVPLR